MVENLQAVGWNGVEAGFKELAKIHPNFSHPSRRPLRVTCLGSGAVGGYAAHAATRYGDPRLREEMVAKNVPGVEVTVVDFDLTWHEDYMLTRLEQADLLIDATSRLDPSLPVIPNRWVSALPRDAVILDLSSDPYLPEADPPMVKGIEGVPQGDLDQWVFAPGRPGLGSPAPRGRHDAPPHGALVLRVAGHPPSGPAWRSTGSRSSRFMTLVLSVPVDEWDERHGTHDVRAAARGELSRWTLAAR